MSFPEPKVVELRSFVVERVDRSAENKAAHVFCHPISLKQSRFFCFEKPVSSCGLLYPVSAAMIHLCIWLFVTSSTQSRLITAIIPGTMSPLILWEGISRLMYDLNPHDLRGAIQRILDNEYFLFASVFSLPNQFVKDNLCLKRCRNSHFIQYICPLPDCSRQSTA